MNCPYCLNPLDTGFNCYYCNKSFSYNYDEEIKVLKEWVNGELKLLTQ